MKSSCLVGFSIEVGSSAPLLPHTHTPHSRGTGSAEHTHTVTMQSNAIGWRTTHFWPIAEMILYLYPREHDNPYRL